MTPAIEDAAKLAEIAVMAVFSSSYQPSVRLRQGIQPMTGILEFALSDEFVPDGLRVLVRRLNRGNPPTAAATAERAFADFRFRIEPGEFEPFLERLIGPFEFFGCVGGFGH